MDFRFKSKFVPLLLLSGLLLGSILPVSSLSTVNKEPYSVNKEPYYIFEKLPTDIPVTRNTFPGKYL